MNFGSSRDYQAAVDILSGLGLPVREKEPQQPQPSNGPKASLPADASRDAAPRETSSVQRADLQGDPVRAPTFQPAAVFERMDIDKPAQDAVEREPPRGHTSDGRLESQITAEAPDPVRRTLFPGRPVTAPAAHDTLDQMLPPQRVLPFANPKLPRPRKHQTGFVKGNEHTKARESPMKTDFAIQSGAGKQMMQADDLPRGVANV